MSKASCRFASAKAVSIFAMRLVDVSASSLYAGGLNLSNGQGLLFGLFPSQRGSSNLAHDGYERCRLKLSCGFTSVHEKSYNCHSTCTGLLLFTGLVFKDLP